MTENNIKEGKYVIVKPPLAPPAAILFPDTIEHKAAVPNGTKVLSAGFYIVEDIQKGRILVYSFGESTSLNMKSKPGDDRIILTTILGN